MKRWLKIITMRRKNYEVSEINQVWKFEKNELKLQFDLDNAYYIFGKKVVLNDIDWHKDLFSGFVYPIKQFDKVHPEIWFNKGIELVFPWELSRFYFGIGIAYKYIATGNIDYYTLFKNLVRDWIKKNTFLNGVNWLSTMDVSIRAVNWIITINLFWDLFIEDSEFKSEISVSLSQHAEYLYSFPLVEKNGLTTNHTVSAFAGLLIISLTLNENPKRDRWLTKAIDGLEKCMSEQVYDDGVDFEGSIPYHRLVLEIFAYSTIVGLANKIEFSKKFYQKLFKMFEYVAAYIDESGNAPQIGDNDSGRFLILNDLTNNPYENEHIHSYLLFLGERIFEYEFKSQFKLKNEDLVYFLPVFEKIKIDKIGVIPRETGSSISFTKGGLHILKNEYFSLAVSTIPIGQGGKGGHNHLDAGSFTLSVDGVQIIVDPGTFCYTRDKNQRDKFREYQYHNTIFTEIDLALDISTNYYWGLKKYYDCELINFDNNFIEIKVKLLGDEKIRYRRFEINNNKVLVVDKYEGEFHSRINFHPSLKEFVINKSQVLLSDKLHIKFSDNIQIVEMRDGEYSPYYGNKTPSKYLVIDSLNVLQLQIERRT